MDVLPGAIPGKNIGKKYMDINLRRNSNVSYD
jgi:hypothetical protein